jgi:hypothetical protein
MPKGYVVIAFTCCSNTTDKFEISYNSSYSVALPCVALKRVKQRPKFFGRPKNFLYFILGHDAVRRVLWQKNNLLFNFLPHYLFTLSTLKMGAAEFRKHLQIYTRLHCLTSKKTVFLIVTTYQTSNLTVCSLVYRHIGDHFWNTKIFSVWRFVQQFPFKCQYLFTKVIRRPTNTMRTQNIIKRGYFITEFET